METDGTGVPRPSENASRQDTTVGLCLGPYGAPINVVLLSINVVVFEANLKSSLAEFGWRFSCLIDPERGTIRAEDARGTPNQSHMSSNILVYEYCGLGFKILGFRGEGDRLTAEMSCATVLNRCSLYEGLGFRV